MTRRAAWLWGLALLLITLAAYSPALFNTWIWDDDVYVTNNPLLQNLSGLMQIWFRFGATPQYYPLVHSTFWIENHLWGIGRPLGFHAVNIVMHGLSAVLLWRLLRRLGVGAEGNSKVQDSTSKVENGRWVPGVAWVAAAVFALHPVDVESVAWVTERKNVMMCLWYLLALWSFLHFDPLNESVAGPQDEAWFGPWRHMRWLLLALFFFVLAMLSKTVASTWPAAVLLLIWWKRGRIAIRDVARVAPFFLIGVPLGLMTAYMEKHTVGAEGAEWSMSLAQRLLVAGRVVWFYAGKLLVPSPLIFVYPRWEVDASVWWQWLFPLAALGVAIGLVLSIRRWGRGPLAGVAFFVGTLVPALGFINVYPFRYSFVADHFQYVACIGLIVLGVCAVAALLRWACSPHAAPIVKPAIAAIVLALLGTLTFLRCPDYANAESLWRDTLAKNNAAWMAHNNLGVILLDQGHIERAIREFEEVLRLKPDHAKARTNMAAALVMQGRIQEAKAEFERAIDIDDQADEAHNGLGRLLFNEGQIGPALEHYKKALKIHPNFPEALLNLGVLLASQHDNVNAKAAIEAAIRAKPNYALGHFNLAAVLSRMGDHNGAVDHYRQAIAIDPSQVEFYKRLGQELGDQGRTNEAVVLLQQARAMRPKDPETLLYLGRVLMRAQRGEEALRAYQQAVEMRPDMPEVHNSYGVALAQLGRLDDAIAQFNEALRLRPNDEDARSNLARAMSLRRPAGQTESGNAPGSTANDDSEAGSAEP